MAVLWEGSPARGQAGVGETMPVEKSHQMVREAMVGHVQVHRRKLPV